MKLKLKRNQSSKSWIAGIIVPSFLILCFTLALGINGKSKLERSNESNFIILKTRLFQIKQKHDNIRSLGLFAAPRIEKRISFAKLQDFPFELKNTERLADLMTRNRSSDCFFSESNLIFVACPVVDYRFSEGFPYVVRPDETLYFWTAYTRNDNIPSHLFINKTKVVIQEELSTLEYQLDNE